MLQLHCRDVRRCCGDAMGLPQASRLDANAAVRAMAIIMAATRQDTSACTRAHGDSMPGSHQPSIDRDHAIHPSIRRSMLTSRAD
jgi:hypothetical protein